MTPPVQGDYQVTADEAAAEVGVSRATVYTWVHRGHLEPVDSTVRPRKFWVSRVYQVEASRNHNLRRSATLAKDPTP